MTNGLAPTTHAAHVRIWAFRDAKTGLIGRHNLFLALAREGRIHERLLVACRLLSAKLVNYTEVALIA
jgi:hypothetical protein